MLGFRRNLTMVDAADALPGRDREMPVPDRHEVLGTPLSAHRPHPTATAASGELA
jgi:peptide-methionine (S)-S-oxide reductase